jgi:hypothetical protein
MTFIERKRRDNSEGRKLKKNEKNDHIIYLSYLSSERNFALLFGRF